MRPLRPFPSESKPSSPLSRLLKIRSTSYIHIWLFCLVLTPQASNQESRLWELDETGRSALSSEKLSASRVFDDIISSEFRSPSSHQHVETSQSETKPKQLTNGLAGTGYVGDTGSTKTTLSNGGFNSAQSDVSEAVFSARPNTEHKGQSSQSSVIKELDIGDSDSISGNTLSDHGFPNAQNEQESKVVRPISHRLRKREVTKGETGAAGNGLVSDASGVSAPRCIAEKPDEPKYFYYGDHALTISIFTTDRITHKLTSTILKIFAEEVLGYSNVTLHHLDDPKQGFDPDIQFSYISSCTDIR